MLALYGKYGQYSIFDNHETGLSKADKNAPSYNEGGAQAGDTFVNQTEGFNEYSRRAGRADGLCQLQYLCLCGPDV
jgi:hypothetical protein